MKNNFLESSLKQFEYYKGLGEKTFERIPADKVSWQYNEECNSIATIVKHMWGNMLSRWTDFLATDGEKSWRQRDAEFENAITSKAELISKWDEGWACFFKAMNTLTDDDLDKKVFIRGIEHTVTDAINRQLAHYAYHVGQIVFIGKMICNDKWESLSIPRKK